MTSEQVTATVEPWCCLYDRGKGTCYGQTVNRTYQETVYSQSILGTMETICNVSCTRLLRKNKSEQQQN